MAVEGSAGRCEVSPCTLMRKMESCFTSERFQSTDELPSKTAQCFHNYLFVARFPFFVKRPLAHILHHFINTLTK